MNSQYKYCTSLTRYVRRKSRVVSIGGVPLGGENPIRIQTMTISDTMDTQASVDECVRIIEAGSDYVRLTAPSIREAENLGNIKKKLREMGFETPLIADIHYTPRAAEAAARIVEKVRINPGNYADRKRFKQIEYTDEMYDAEIQRIYERFSPLVKICREHGAAMRIGTNHGSLSDRIMNRYGDTPLGMVESAMEFIRICEDHRYFDIVLSMKSSNPLVMVQAYRLLVNKMDAENMQYPLHLGVTEAGEGEDGRIKSALGIGTLLDDGLGDTIRVSLTEPPEHEIPVAREILKRYETIETVKEDSAPQFSPVNPFEYERRYARTAGNIGGKEVPRVIADFSGQPPGFEEMKGMGYTYNPNDDKWAIGDSAVDYIYLGAQRNRLNLPPGIGLIYDFSLWKSMQSEKNTYPMLTLKEFKSASARSDSVNFIRIPLSLFDASQLDDCENTVIVLEAGRNQSMPLFRSAFFELMKAENPSPVVIKRDYSSSSESEIQINSAVDIGGLFVDGLGDGVMITPSNEHTVRTVFGVLQASRTRISRTEYISCPSCGRTLFDLQKTGEKIRKSTSHLKGVKIGIMGCIVNGPGEMADADYGYVGTGVGKISLYRGKEVVQKNIPTKDAVQALIELIKNDGRWFEPGV
ncbi:(E)-4-hydroxy-3-methylbut-2-enyl-diphosphate synthase [candidate division KSB1 bacterium]